MLVKQGNLEARLAIALIAILLWSTIAPASAAEDFDSLSAAIAAANAGGASTITLTEDIRLSGALPVITAELTIDGSGFTLSGDETFRIFDVDGGRLTISHVTLTAGRNPEGQGGALRLSNGARVSITDTVFSGNSAASGGAIASLSYNNRLTISGSSFVRNSATEGGAFVSFGGISEISGSAFGDNSADESGGAIAVNEGRLRVSNSTFSGNAAVAGGAIYTGAGETTLTHLTLVGNKSDELMGAGIHRERGIINLRNSIVAGSDGGADCAGFMSELRRNFSQDGTCSTAVGGEPMLAETRGEPAHYPLLDESPAVDAADAEYCLEVDQLGTARPRGAACDIGAFESTTAKASATTLESLKCSLADHIISANRNIAVGNCPRGTSHDIITLSEDITLSEALPPIVGTITIDGQGHTLSGGGAQRLFDVSGGRLTLKDVTLTQGHSDGDGGAIRLRNGGKLVAENATFKDNWANRGGVIAALSADSSVTISRSSFVDNAAELQGGVFLLNGGITAIAGSSFVNNESESAWGGVFHARNSRLSVVNSSFSGNEGLAGGVLAQMSGQASLTHVTMINNKSDFLGGDALYRYGGAIVLRNSIVVNRGEIEDCSGGLSVQSGNLNPDGTCADLPSEDVKVDRLTGAPAYFPLKDGSPALDAANADFCQATDQLGTPRPKDKCDIGAIESTTAVAATAPIVPPPPCPLYHLIAAANTDAPSGGCRAGEGHDIIVLEADITLDRLLPRITSDITIEGNGHTISGDGRFRIFNVTEGTLTLNNVTLTKGRVPANAKGGAILIENVGRVVVNDSTFSANTAKEGGAIFVTGSASRLSVMGSSFNRNQAISYGAGGAIVMEYGRVEIRNSSFIGNRSDNIGGAIGTWAVAKSA